MGSALADTAALHASLLCSVESAASCSPALLSDADQEKADSKFQVPCFSHSFLSEDQETSVIWSIELSLSKQQPNG